MDPAIKVLSTLLIAEIAGFEITQNPFFGLAIVLTLVAIGTFATAHLAIFFAGRLFRN